MNGGTPILASEALKLNILGKRRCAFTYKGERHVGVLFGKAVHQMSDIWQDDAKGPVLIPWAHGSQHADMLFTDFEIDVPVSISRPEVITPCGSVPEVHAAKLCACHDKMDKP